MMNLTPRQQAILVSKEKESFLLLCKQASCDPADRESQVFEGMRAEVQQVVADVAERNPRAAERLLREYEVVMKGDDVWKALGFVNDMTKRIATRDLLQSYSLLPINYEYLERLGARIGVATPREDCPEALESFVEAIPLMTFYTTEFSAFLRGKSQIDSLPCICVFEQLNYAVKCFANVLPTVMMEFDDPAGVDALDTREVLAAASAPSFRRVCEGCLESLFCTSIEVPAPPDRYVLLASDLPNAATLYNLMLSGALDFVLFHEMGHLLMGHLDIGPCHRVEFEADAFAAMVVARSLLDLDQALGWRCNGIALLFALLRILEAARGDRPSKTHPPATRRLKSLSGTLGASNASAMELYYRAFLEACNPTLEKRWGWRVTD